MSDRYGYIAIETLLNFCENSKDHVVTPNDFMRMARVRVPEQKTGKWLSPGYLGDAYKDYWWCSECQTCFRLKTNYCPHCGARMLEIEDE